MSIERQIVVLGSNGMLGRYIVKYFQKKNIKVIPLTRKTIDVAEAKLGFLDPINLNKNDIIINCAGVIKSQANEHNVENTIKVNSIFPYILQEECERLNVKAIHISTDCVFSGRLSPGMLDESVRHDATDIYGKSKSLGEAPKLTTIRTSIIGEEINQTRSLIEWLKSKKNMQVNGFTNHLWNGVTCLQLAKIIDEIINKQLFFNGVRHFYNKQMVCKEELLKLISDAFELNVTVLKHNDINYCDRSLGTIYEDTKDILEKIPNYKTQLEELKDFDIKQ